MEPTVDSKSKLGVRFSDAILEQIDKHYNLGGKFSGEVMDEVLSKGLAQIKLEDSMKKLDDAVKAIKEFQGDLDTIFTEFGDNMTRETAKTVSQQTDRMAKLVEMQLKALNATQQVEHLFKTLQEKHAEELKRINATYEKKLAEIKEPTIDTSMMEQQIDILLTELLCATPKNVMI